MCALNMSSEEIRRGWRNPTFTFNDVQWEEVIGPIPSIQDTDGKLVNVINTQPSWKRLFNVQRKNFFNFCDVHFITEEGYIPFHSVFLKGLSPFLDSLLPEINVPCKYDVISISVPDIPMSHLKSFLTLIYSGVVTLTSDATENDIRNVMKLLYIGQLSLECLPCDRVSNKRNKTVRCYRNAFMKDERHGSIKSVELKPVATSVAPSSSCSCSGLASESRFTSRCMVSSSQQERPSGSVDMKVKQEMKPTPIRVQTRKASVYLECLDDQKIRKFGELVKSGRKIALSRPKLPIGMEYALEPKHSQICATSRSIRNVEDGASCADAGTKRPRTRPLTQVKTSVSFQLAIERAEEKAFLEKSAVQPEPGPSPYFHHRQSNGLIKKSAKESKARKKLNCHKQSTCERKKKKKTPITSSSPTGTSKTSRCSRGSMLVKLKGSGKKRVQNFEKTEGFHCNTCGKRFRAWWGLLVHERTHTGVKPYKCQICCEAFTQNGNLKIHILRHHPHDGVLEK